MKDTKGKTDTMITPKQEPAKVSPTAPKPAAIKPAAVETAPEKKPTASSTETLKVLFCISEAQPHAASGGLGEVGGSLPRAIKVDSPNTDIRVIMPLYKVV